MDWSKIPKSYLIIGGIFLFLLFLLVLFLLFIDSSSGSVNDFEQQSFEDVKPNLPSSSDEGMVEVVLNNDPTVKFVTSLLNLFPLLLGLIITVTIFYSFFIDREV